LAGELARLYRGEELSPLEIQYKDFSQWQNQRTAEGKLRKQEEYWLDHLGGELPVLNLPFDYPRPPVQSFEGERISFELDNVLTGRLHILMKETGTTLYMMLLSILNILLGWYSNREDIITGSPIAGRNHAGIENTVGFFLETLAIRNRPAPGKLLLEFLNEVKRTTLNAYENGDYPFSLLIKHLLPMNDLSRNPLFDVMLNVLNQPATNFELEGVTLLPYELDIRIAKLDLTLEAVEQNGAIRFELEYCTALFKKQTMERLIGHFFNITRETVFNPGIRIGEIEIIAEDEKKQILVEFNKPIGMPGEEKTVIDYFEISAAKYPDRIAVIGHGRHRRTRTNTDNNITYFQLNKQSDRLAGLLIEKGVLPDDIIAIKIERSIEMIIGIFGILKAGGAYLPIDQEYPQERIDYMLKDSKAKIIVNSEFLMDAPQAPFLQHSAFKSSLLRHLHLGVYRETQRR
jgi:surfactin family lipopeptide synthetase A/bacitracin synthase 1/bacitracin synthase 2/bacitracin synthase 3